MKTLVNVKAVLLSLMLFALSNNIFALEPIPYIDENGDTQYVTNYKILTGKETKLTRGWYVIKDSIEFDIPKWEEIEVFGNVHIVMMDNSVCVINGGGGFNGYESGSTMSIYSQSHGDDEGKMIFDIHDLFFFMLWKLNIYGGCFTLDGYNKISDVGVVANYAVLKDCTIDAHCGFLVGDLTTDGVDLTVKAVETALSTNHWTIKNTDQTPVINISGWENNNVGSDVELPEGMEMTIGKDKYKGTISPEVINDSEGFSVSAGSDSPTVIESVQSEWSASQGREGWFTLNGVRLANKPIEKGIYIHNGRKVVVK